MQNYVLSCESTVDLTRAYLESRNIAYLCYPYALGGVEHRDDFGETISYEEFYGAMERGEETKTAQINSWEFEQYFEGFLREGKDVVHLCLSSGITGVLNSAMAARDALAEKYPERRIYLVDSLAASSGFGLLVDALADLRDGGMEAAELAAWAEENRLRVHHWFFSEDLKYYIRGGRISKTAGMVGTMLGICPLLDVSADGHLTPREKIRSKKRVISAIVDKMTQHADHRTDYSGKCFISYSGGPESARQVEALVRQTFPKLKALELYHIGAIIGSHSGPGTVALFFWGDARTPEADK